LIRQDLLDCASLGCVHGIVGKPFASRGAWALFRDISTLWWKSYGFLNFCQIKKNLNSQCYFYFGCSNGIGHTTNSNHDEMHIDFVSCFINRVVGVVKIVVAIVFIFFLFLWCRKDITPILMKI